MIRLDDLLKAEGVVDSGGQAKTLVQGGNVHVNGEVDTRRGRKLFAGNRVTVAGRTIHVDAALKATRGGHGASHETGGPARRARTPFDAPAPKPKAEATPKRAKPTVPCDSGKARRGKR